MIKQYKCPNCGGAVGFDSESQRMSCPYCDCEFEIADLEDYRKELEENPREGICWTEMDVACDWQGAEVDDLTCGSCPSCGAELMGDANTAAMVCPCCGNAQIVERRLSGLLRPDWVIPFRLDRNAALAALAKFCEKKRLLPDSFWEENRIEGVQGLYVPFWLFDARARGHIRYRASKVTTWSDSRFNYIKTDYYSVVRDGAMAFEKIPADGSDKMDDKYMDSIEPFRYEDLKPFRTAFLAGFTAEKYDVPAEKSRDRAGARIRASIEEEFARSVSGYSSVKLESTSIDIENGKVHYSLFPVWVLNTKHRNKNHVFMMNGQTGVLAGKLPVDTAKCWKYRLLFTGIFGGLFALAAQALRHFVMEDVPFLHPHNYFMLGIGLVLALVTGFSIVGAWKCGMDTVNPEAGACQYAVPGSLEFRQKKDRFLYSNIVKTMRAEQAAGGGRGRR